MGLLIAATDFTAGKHDLAIAPEDTERIDAYIARYEEPYLIDLLGVVLFNLFKADIAVQPGPPAAAIYLAIYNAIREDDGCIRISRGMKDMVKAFVWWEYVRDQKYKHTKAGFSVDRVENGSPVNFDDVSISTRYNEAIRDYETIQWYIRDNSNQYPDYNGQDKGMSHWAL